MNTEQIEKILTKDAYSKQIFKDGVYSIDEIPSVINILVHIFLIQTHVPSLVNIGLLYTLIKKREGSSLIAMALNHKCLTSPII